MLVWIINGLFGLLTAAVLVILKLHQKADDEHRKRMDDEIQSLRKRLHDLDSMVGQVKSEQAYQSRHIGG